MSLLQAAAVARMIGYSGPAAFLRDRARLERDHGFPAPMPTCRRPLKWRREAVAAWIASNGTAPPAPAVRPLDAGLMALAAHA